MRLGRDRSHVSLSRHAAANRTRRQHRVSRMSDSLADRSLARPDLTQTMGALAMKTLRFGLTLVIIAVMGGCSSLGGGAHLPPPVARRETVRDFLLHDNAEGEGYGLYSYVLFGKAPGEQDRERYESVVAAFLKVPTAILVEGDGQKRCNLNITYLLLGDAPPEWIANLNAAEPAELARAAKWIVTHYDYLRSQQVLTRFGTYTRGPYLISSLAPLHTDAPEPDRFLWQDLSAQVPSLADAWVDEFMREASKNHFWEREELARFMLELRNGIALAAEVPGLDAQLSSLIKLVSPSR